MKPFLTSLFLLLSLSSFGQTVTKAVLANLDTLVTTTTVKYDTLHYKQPIPGGVISPPATYSNQSNITISSKTFNGSTLSFSNCSNVHITWCRFNGGTGTNLYAINFYNCTNVTVDYCYGTMYCKFVMVKGGIGIKVNNNQFLNLYEPVVYNADFAHAIQFNGVTGAGNQVTNNTIENTSAAVHPHDIINLYNCSGTTASHILVSENVIRGGQTIAWPTSGDTGAGITLDNGNYIDVTNNVGVNPGCAFIQVNGTHNNILVDNNKGVSLIVSKVSADCFIALGSKTNVTFSNNQANWLKRNGAYGVYPGGETGFWAGGGFPPSGITFVNNNWFNKALLPTVIPATLITYK